MFKNIKKDWWLWNSLLYLLSGIFVFIVFLLSGDLVYGLFSGGLNILIGFALLGRSKIGYWLVLFLAGYTFIGQVSRLVSIAKTDQFKDFPVDFSFVFSAVGLAFAVMLWQQVRREKQK